MNPVTNRYCDNVPKTIADLINEVYTTSSDRQAIDGSRYLGFHDEKTLDTIAEIYYWNVDLFIKFIWDSCDRWSQERILVWLNFLDCA